MNTLGRALEQLAGCLAKQQKSSSQGQSTTVMPRVTEVVLNLIGGYFTQVDFVLIALQFVIIETGNTIPQLLIPLTLMMIAVETSVDQIFSTGETENLLL